VKLGPWKDHLVKEPTALAEAYLAATQTQDARRRVA
jgi:hypothetical protein